jgi:hypothetical protein
VGKPLDDGFNLDKMAIWSKANTPEYREGYDKVNWPSGKTKIEKRLEEDICQKK